MLYVGAQRHWSLDRAGKVIGLQPSQIRPVPLDGEFRMRRKHPLLDSIRIDRERGWTPWTVCTNAARPVPGTVDALIEIAELCRFEGLMVRCRRRLWLGRGVDRGWKAGTGRHSPGGFDLITLDPHKWLAHFDVGCLLVRDGRLLPETFGMRPDYLQDVLPGEGEVNYTDHGIALTRRFRALRFLGSRSFVRPRLVPAAGRALLHARRVCPGKARIDWDSRDSLSATTEHRVLSLRRSESRRSSRIQRRAVAAPGTPASAALSSTRLDGKFAIRMCFVNWRTTAADVDEIIDLLLQLGPKVAAGQVVPKESSIPPCVLSELPPGLTPPVRVVRLMVGD